MRYVALLLTLASACTAENPAYQPSDDGTLDRPDLGVEGGDLRGAAGCSQGERRCRQGALGWTSQFCHRGTWVDDRRCPQDSVCDAGYCQRPPEQGFFEGKPCARENDCFSLAQPSTPYACTPFVQLPDRHVETFCALQVSPAGTGFPGTPCQPNDGLACRSGFCDEDTHPAGNGSPTHYCFRPCDISIDCPTTHRFDCLASQITVEGVTFTGEKSCVPAN